MKKKQQILIGEPVGNGMRAGVMRREDGKVQPGVFADLGSGRPLSAGDELITSEDKPGEWCDAKTIYRYPNEDVVEEASSVVTLSGPPQVATPAYRAGYDRIFGKKQEVGIA